MNTVLCNVSGISNKECKTQIKNALNKIDGIHEVGVSMASGTVMVEFNEPANENSVRSCIESAGFKII